jgi:hypothetical protein
MLPRRKKIPEPSKEAPPPQLDSIAEILQSQIAEERATAKASSRAENRRVVPKKKPQQEMSPTRLAEPEYGTCEVSTEPFDSPAIPREPTAFSYFDRITHRDIMDDPLADFPGLRRILDAQ